MRNHPFGKSPDSVQCGQPYKGVAALLKYNQRGGSVRQGLCRTAELNKGQFIRRVRR